MVSLARGRRSGQFGVEDYLHTDNKLSTSLIFHTS